MTDVAFYAVGIKTRFPATYRGSSGRSYQFNNPNVPEAIPAPNPSPGDPSDLSVVNVDADDVSVLKSRYNLTSKNGRNRGSSNKDLILFKTEEELTAQERSDFGLPAL